MKERKNKKKNNKKHEPSLTFMRQMVLEISHPKVRNWSKMEVFSRFSASFSRKYDVNDTIQHDNEKMKMQYY